MSPGHEQLYRRTLRALVAAGVEFCVIGSLALRWQCPALAQWPAHDCDLLLPFAVPVIEAAVRHLQGAGWEISLWQEPVPLPLTLELLRGKYYLRARRQGAILDLCFENDYRSWADFAAGRGWRQGLPLASVGHLLDQCARRQRPADQEILRRCQAGMPGAPG